MFVFQSVGAWERGYVQRVVIVYASTDCLVEIKKQILLGVGVQAFPLSLSRKSASQFYCGSSFADMKLIEEEEFDFDIPDDYLNIRSAS